MDPVSQEDLDALLALDDQDLMARLIEDAAETTGPSPASRSLFSLVLCLSPSQFSNPPSQIVPVPDDVDLK